MRVAAAALSGFLILSIAGPAELLSEPDYVCSAPFASQVRALLLLWALYGIAGAVAGSVARVLQRFVRAAPGAAWGDAAAFAMLTAVAANALRPESAWPMRYVTLLAALPVGLLGVALLRRVGRWPIKRPILLLANGLCSLGIAHFIVAKATPHAWPASAIAGLVALPALFLLALMAAGAPDGARSIAARAMLGVGLVLLGVRVWSAQSNPGRNDSAKNLLLITIDTLRADHLGVYGNPGVYTPNIDALAGMGTLFANATTPVPLTYPAHATMLSGLYPGDHGVVNNIDVRLPAGTNTLPLALERAGYRTAAFVSGYTLARAQSRLWEHFQLYDDDHSGVSWMPERVVRTPLLGALKRVIPRLRPLAKRAGAGTARAATDWLRRNAETPFFLWVHFYDPHGPYEPPRDLEAVYGIPERAAERNWYRLSEAERAELIGEPQRVEWMKRRYAAEVTYADRQVGELLEALVELDVMKRTLVVLTSDHGESLTEHGYYFDHGGRLYDQSMMVPLIVHDPEIRGAGRLRSDTGALTDLMATVLQRMGIEEPAPGRALLSPGYSGDAGDWSIAALFHGQGMLAVRRGGYKYIHNGEGGFEELYHLESDPRESVNLAGANDSLIVSFRELAAQASAGWIERSESSEALSPEQQEMLRSLGYVE